MTRYVQAFNGFLQNLPFYGSAVMCIDDRGVRDLLPELTRKVVTYGHHSDADYRLENYRAEGLKSHFDLVCQRTEKTLPLTVRMPGFHNAQKCRGRCSSLPGARRQRVRYQGRAWQNLLVSAVASQILVMCSWAGGCARLIDDYGHHPTEVAVTLKATREAFPDRRVVMVYQPHRFSRTRDHFDDFVAVLGESETLLLLEVYAAGEAAIAGASAEALAQAIRVRRGVEPAVVSDQRELAAILIDVLEDRDILLMQGAGDIGRLSATLSDVVLSRCCSDGVNFQRQKNSRLPWVVMPQNDQFLSRVGGMWPRFWSNRERVSFGLIPLRPVGWSNWAEASFVFNLLHGPGGEDGTIQGLFRMDEFAI